MMMQVFWSCGDIKAFLQTHNLSIEPVYAVEITPFCDHGIYEEGSSAAILVSTLLCILTILAILALAFYFGLGVV